MNFPFTLAENRRFDVVGFGLNAVDHLVSVPRYPAFNTKSAMTEHRQSPGGQVSSAMVGAQRLGLNACYIGKVGNDHEGKLMIDSLRDEGVASLLIVRFGYYLNQNASQCNGHKLKVYASLLLNTVSVRKIIRHGIGIN